MSIKCIQRVWEHSRAKGSAKLVLLAIADHAKEDGTNAWPSLARLMKMTGLGQRYVITLLQNLEASGELEIHHRAGPHRSNLYAVMVGLADVPEPAPVPETILSQDSPEPGLIMRRDSVDTEPGLSSILSQDSENPLRTVKNRPMEQKEKQPRPADTKAKKGRAKSSRADPRTKTPAIQCAYAVAGNRYPPLEIYDDVIGALGDKPDGKRLAACRKAWVWHGHNRNSWTWLLEWYVEGIPEYARKAAGEEGASAGSGAWRKDDGTIIMPS